MTGTWRGVRRTLAIGTLLALALLMAAAGEARAGRYAVAQCGWYVGADAAWADTTGGLKFRPDAFCVPAGADSFDGAHLKSFTRDGQSTVSGTRFARWRWQAPPGTGITQVRGTWWQTLHDGLEQRLGAVQASGAFEPFLSAVATDTTPREFTRGFPTPVAAFEDRLLCARAESKWCSLDPGSWSALRALTLTVDDPTPPGAWITGGDLTAGGWRRGTQSVTVSGYDSGAGVRYGETILDGARVALTEYPCEKVLVGGEWRGTRMQPCLTNVGATHSVATTTFSDGTHSLAHCTTDFAGNQACAPTRTVLIDNNPPVHPRSPQVAGPQGWRRVDDFDVTWENPGQGPASPIAGAEWEVVGPGGYDSHVAFAPGRDRHSLNDLRVPAAGIYSLRLWLRDEAGNEDPATAVTLPLRLDDAGPKAAFAVDPPQDQLRADVSDALSGPASGWLYYRRLDDDRWTELPAKLLPSGAGAAQLVAPMPELDYGIYVFRADAADAAGNVTSTSLRADGTQMAVRKVAPPHVSQPQVTPPPRRKTRLFARLGGGRGHGDALTVRFAAPATLRGRLTDAEGGGLGGRELRVVSRASRGATVPALAEGVTTGPQGRFKLRLAAGPSRRVTVSFPGDDGLEPSRRPGLQLRVRSGVSLRVAPLSLETGEVVRLRGRVDPGEAAIPRRGKLVAIQYLEAETGRWRPVLVTRSDHDGRFRAHYRFRYVSGRAAIRLRATALAEERWPFAPGSSAPATVRVSGAAGDR